MHNQIPQRFDEPAGREPILPARMRVLHIISGDLWAGAEAQAFTLLNSLKHECDLCVAIMNHGELAERLRNSGIQVQILDESKLSSPRILFDLTRLISHFQPDIVHTHRQKENILGALAGLLGGVAKFKRIPSVRTAHGAPEHNSVGLKKMIVALDRLCGKYLQNAIISVSDDLTRKLSRIFSTKHIHTIHNGIDQASLRDTRPASDVRALAPHAIHIGIVGRLEPVKRVDLFLLAAKQLCEKVALSPLQFHVIGDGKQRSALEAMAQQLGLTNLKFHGHRSDSQAAIAALDMVVMCSDHEGTPMTALETLAFGKPLIAHHVGGLAELLAEFPELLVREHHPKGYAEAIFKAINHRPVTRLPARYTSEENGSRTLQLYRNLASNTCR